MIVNVNNVKELKTIVRADDDVTVGAAVSLSDLKDELESIMAEKDGEKI